MLYKPCQFDFRKLVAMAAAAVAARNSWVDLVLEAYNSVNDSVARSYSSILDVVVLKKRRKVTPIDVRIDFDSIYIACVLFSPSFSFCLGIFYIERTRQRVLFMQRKEEIDQSISDRMNKYVPVDDIRILHVLKKKDECNNFTLIHFFRSNYYR